MADGINSDFGMDPHYQGAGPSTHAAGETDATESLAFSSNLDQGDDPYGHRELVAPQHTPTTVGGETRTISGDLYGSTYDSLREQPGTFPQSNYRAGDFPGSVADGDGNVIWHMQYDQGKIFDMSEGTGSKDYFKLDQMFDQPMLDTVQDGLNAGDLVIVPARNDAGFNIVHKSSRFDQPSEFVNKPGVGDPKTRFPNAYQEEAVVEGGGSSGAGEGEGAGEGAGGADEHYLSPENLEYSKPANEAWLEKPSPADMKAWNAYERYGSTEFTDVQSVYGPDVTSAQLPPEIESLPPGTGIYRSASRPEDFYLRVGYGSHGTEGDTEGLWIKLNADANGNIESAQAWLPSRGEYVSIASEDGATDGEITFGEIGTWIRDATTDLESTGQAPIEEIRSLVPDELQGEELPGTWFESFSTTLGEVLDATLEFITFGPGEGGVVAVDVP